MVQPRSRRQADGSAGIGAGMRYIMRHFQVTIPSVFFLLAAVLGAFFLPGLLKPFFDGPDGAFWVAPFFLWMGLWASAGWIWLSLLKGKNNGWEELYLRAGILFFTAMFLFVGLQRFSSGLRGLEGFQEFMGYRVFAGPDIYADPEVSPAGNHYTPLLFLLTSLFYRIIPSWYGFGRLISIAATLVTLVFVYKTISRNSGSRIPGLWGALVFISLYSVLDKLFDWALCDPLQMALTSVCLWFFLARSPRGDALALFFGGAACFAKQPGAPAFAAVLLFVIASRRSWKVYWPLLFWGTAAAGLVIGTGGRAWTYLAGNPTSIDYASFIEPDTRFRVFVLMFPLWAVFLLNWKSLKDPRLAVFGLAQFTASVMGAWVASGWVNTFMPFAPVLVVMALAGQAPGRLTRILLALQVALGLYNPFSTLYPWKTIRDTDHRIVQAASAAAGEVWLPGQPYLYPLTGKVFWDDMGVMEGYCASGHPAPRRLLEAVAAERFEIILLRKEGEFWFPGVCGDLEAEVNLHYRRQESEGMVSYTPAAGRGGAVP